MKKVTFALILIMLLNFIAPVAMTSGSAFAAGELPAFELSDGEMDYLNSIKDTPISLAITSELMSFVNPKGEKSGVLQPLIGLMEDRWELTVEIVNAGWTEAFGMLNSGEVDMLGLAILNEKRQSIYDSTEALFNSNIDIYTYKDTPLNSVVDIKGQTIGLMSSFVLPEMLEVYLTSAGGINYYETVEELISALERGDIFCIATTLMIQSELLKHPDVNYKMSVESVITPQCVYSKSERLSPLIDLINRYLKSREGAGLIADINSNRHKCTLEKYSEFFKDDINYIKANYDELRIFDSGMMYPLSYVQNGKYNGLQTEINDVIRELTGVPVKVLDFSKFDDTEDTVVEALEKGEILAAAGIYRSNKYDEEALLEYSIPIMTDMLSFYVRQNNTISSLSEMRIGSHDFSSSYMNWNITDSSEPVIYDSLEAMIGDLRQNKLDAVFIGEMMTDYYYTVLNDYTVKRFDNLAVPANVHMLYNSDNKSFNRLMDAAIKIQVVAAPANRQIWSNRSQNSKFEVMWLRSQMDTFRTRTIVAAVFLVVALAVLLVFVMYQLLKFKNFDKQISMMLSAQGNADMVWGNLKTKRIISKGDYPISKKLGLSEEATKSFTDVDSLAGDVGIISEQGLAYYMREIEVKPENGDSTYYFRRITHKINEVEFMVYVMDFTAEKYREKELSKLANTDYLTKLPNRRAMNDLLSKKVSEISTCSKKIFVFMMDIDNFKQVNDSCGHNVGDSVLYLLARILEARMPDGNASRWGGEEFLCVAEIESYEKAIELARNILYEFESTEITVGKTKSFSSTISCGVSELVEGEAYTNAVTRADKAMYQAKCEGKNCVRYIGAGELSHDSSGVQSEDAEEIGISVTYDRVMSRVVQAFFHSSSIDSVIMELLKTATVYNGLDRAYIFEKTDECVFERTYVYDPENLGPSSPIGMMTAEEIEKLRNLRLTEPRFVSDAEAKISAAELKVRSKGIKSFAQLPIFAGSELIGMVGFDNCREIHEWTNDENRVLNDVAVILGEFVVRKELERRLMLSNNAMTSILDSIDEYVYVSELESKKLLFANKKARDVIGDTEISSKTCWEVVRPDLDGPCDYCMHTYLVDENGEPTGKAARRDIYNSMMGKWFDVTFTLIEWEGGKKAVVMVCRDVTGRKSLEETQKRLLNDLRREKEKQRLLLEILQSQEVKTTLALEGASSYSWEYTPEADKLVLSKTAEQALGYPLEYFNQRHSKYMESLAFDYAPKTIKKLNAYINGETNIYTSEYPIVTASGETRWYLARGRYADDNGNKDVIYGVCIDITENKLHEQLLSERAYKDTLTGLLNNQYISDGLIKPSSDKFTNFGGILLDIRSFKNINEAFGYDYGNKVIKSIVGKLKEIFADKLLVKVSGDRFLAVFENTSIEELKDYAEKVIGEFGRPILADGQLIGIEFRMGIAIRRDAEATKLLKDTEIALYSAKESLTNDYRVLSDDAKLAFSKKVNMEFELRSAIERQEFVMYYQPAVFTTTKRIAGAEALIRWRHPELGVVPPLDFIPLAEDTGLIVPIGEFVIRESISQLKQWLDKGIDIYISFNLSARQFLSPQLRTYMRNVLEKHKIPQNRLVIEITESTMISDFEYVKEILREFESFGIGVSLDDFGTGYSSMNYVGKIPLSYLKIDKSFIENATTVSRDRAILESIVTMSRKLGFKVTAEGVETAEQVAMLEELGCDTIQGFYFSEPLPKEEFEDFIKSTRPGIDL